MCASNLEFLISSIACKVLYFVEFCVVQLNVQPIAEKWTKCLSEKEGR